MSRPDYEVWLGPGRATHTVTSFSAAKEILRRDFEFHGRVFLSEEYNTDQGVGWAAYPSALLRWEGGTNNDATIERIDRVSEEEE